MSWRIVFLKRGHSLSGEAVAGFPAGPPHICVDNGESVATIMLDEVAYWRDYEKRPVETPEERQRLGEDTWDIGL